MQKNSAICNSIAIHKPDVTTSLEKSIIKYNNKIKNLIKNLYKNSDMTEVIMLRIRELQEEKKTLKAS